MDRHGGSPLGRYHTTVADMYEPYPKPQSMGNREALRDLTLYTTDGDKREGIRIETVGQVAFSVLHYDDVTLKNAAHTWELVRPGGVYAHFDYMQLGVGNGSCGTGTGTLPAYQLPASGTYRHSLRFIPLQVYEGAGIDRTRLSPVSVAYDAATRQVICTGSFGDGATATLYDMGSLPLATATSTGNRMALPAVGLPHGSYLVVVDSGRGRYTCKIVL